MHIVDMEVTDRIESVDLPQSGHQVTDRRQRGDGTSMWKS